MGKQGSLLAMINSIKDDDFDFIFQKNWKFVAKKTFEQMCKHQLKSLYVGYGLDFHSKLFVGDAEHIYAYSIAFAFGNGKRLLEFPKDRYNLHARRTMVDVNELDYEDELLVLHSMFYTNSPITLMKNRYGICGSSIAPASLLDAVNKVGLTTEELLIQYDLSLAGDL